MHKVSSRDALPVGNVCNISFLALLHNWMFWMSFSEQTVHASICFDAVNGPVPWLSSPGAVGFEMLRPWERGSGRQGTRLLRPRPFLPPLPQGTAPTWGSFSILLFLHSKVLFSPSLQTLSSGCLFSASGWSIKAKQLVI